MTNITASLPVDPTGQNPANLILTEYQQITGGARGVLRPNWGSFFKDSLQIYSVSGSDILSPMTYGTDYAFAEIDTLASENSGKVVYQAILILNPLLTSTFSLTYQAYGGLENQNRSLIYTYANVYTYGASIPYSNLTNVPTLFPPASHTHDIADVYGMEWLSSWLNRIGSSVVSSLANNDVFDLRYKIKTFSDAVTASTTLLSTAIGQHLANTGYSHTYTASMLGLGNLLNYGTTDPGAGGQYYATPFTVAAKIASPPAVNTTMINAHKANVANPHSDTAATIGLGSVANYGIQLTYSAGQYTSMFANGATVTYLGPYPTANAVSEFTAAQYNAIYTVPAAAISNGSTGILDNAATARTQAATAISSSTTALNGIATNETTVVNNANQTTATIARYAIVYNNAAYAAMLTKISQYDYSQNAIGASVSGDGYWPVPANLSGLYLWLSANNRQNTLFPDANGNLRVTKLVDASSYGRTFSAPANSAPIFKACTDVAAGASGITQGYVLSFTNGVGLTQDSGPIARLSPGMTVIAIFKTPPAGKVFNLLSSNATGKGINVFGNSASALVDISSTGWNALRAPANSQVANASTVFCAVIAAASEASSWCVSNVALSSTPHPRGVDTPAGTWPDSTYVGDALDVVGNINYAVNNVGELAELIIFKRALSGAEGTAILEYVRLRYNHSAALAVDYTPLTTF